MTRENPTTKSPEVMVIGLDRFRTLKLPRAAVVTEVLYSEIPSMDVEPVGSPPARTFTRWKGEPVGRWTLRNHWSCETGGSLLGSPIAPPGSDDRSCYRGGSNRHQGPRRAEPPFACAAFLVEPVGDVMRNGADYM